ncbi:MAG: spore cortex-lytic enzyme [Firmicutes bacterium]|uniref:Spore cortex-lytic enzyme n=1 Tax=Candidatus Stercoripulliclostridium pullicola TaxID=2840953 RepID=A0A940DFD1_9FIRM|nr:spore cortex-lytic enzyme [Candidatus Stercoripulliclostridium pullicola]
MSEKTEKILRFTVVPVLLVAIVAAIIFAFNGFESSESAEAAVLKQGSTGSVVRTVQTRLKSWGYYTGSVDGIYGSLTVAAVKYFQRVNGLQVDGIVGEKTAAAIGISLASSSSSGAGGYSSSDAYLLARLVYAEARGEPYVGQVAVAAVVLNRVKSSSFPNTISGVIYQPWAFSVVNDGQINLTPNQTAINAANDAMNGWDPTYGCLYYYNPATATNSWIKQKPIHLTIGQHVFCA